MSRQSSIVLLIRHKLLLSLMCHRMRRQPPARQRWSRPSQVGEAIPLPSATGHHLLCQTSPTAEQRRSCRQSQNPPTRRRPPVRQCWSKPRFSATGHHHLRQISILHILMRVSGTIALPAQLATRHSHLSQFPPQRRSRRQRRQRTPRRQCLSKVSHTPVQILLLSQNPPMAKQRRSRTSQQQITFNSTEMILT